MKPGRKAEWVGRISVAIIFSLLIAVTLMGIMLGFIFNLIQSPAIKVKPELEPERFIHIKTITLSAMLPFEINILFPLMMYSSSLRQASVIAIVTSDPASGSVMAVAKI